MVIPNVGMYNGNGSVSCDKDGNGCLTNGNDIILKQFPYSVDNTT